MLVFRSLGDLALVELAILEDYSMAVFVLAEGVIVSEPFFLLVFEELLVEVLACS